MFDCVGLFASLLVLFFGFVIFVDVRYRDEFLTKALYYRSNERYYLDYAQGNHGSSMLDIFAWRVCHSLKVTFLTLTYIILEKVLAKL